MNRISQADKAIKNAIKHMADQDLLFQGALDALQKNGQELMRRRVERFVKDSREAMTAYAKTADINGIRQVLKERDKFITLMLASLPPPPIPKV